MTSPTEDNATTTKNRFLRALFSKRGPNLAQLLVGAIVGMTNIILLVVFGRAFAFPSVFVFMGLAALLVLALSQILSNSSLTSDQ